MFTSTILSHSSIFRDFTKLRGINPALFIKTSIVPYFSIACLTKLSQSDFLVTSVSQIIISPPSSVISFFKVSNLSNLLAPATIFAPFFASALAVEYPIPLDAPVITTTLSCIKAEFYEFRMTKNVT